MTEFSLEAHPESISQSVKRGHNRWHPDIPPMFYCESGQTLEFETLDALDSQLNRASTSSDVARVDMGRLHPLAGPVYVAKAKPGDLLEVEVIEILPDSFGYTSQHVGFGLLREHFPEPYLARWDISNGVATSPDIPGVTIPGDPFMGVMGVAPDHALVKTARKREEEIIAAGGLAYPPVSPHSAVPGGMVGKSGLRTGPPRENGGNIDIRQTRVGTRLFFPVLVEGALFSTGDAHFAQGDGEVCGAAIEMNATVRLRFTIHPGQAENQDVHALRFIYNESAERSRNYIATTGISVSASGSSSPEDSTLAAKQALLEMIRYLERRGYTQQQAYALCSVAADLRLSQLVNGPNALVTAVLPLDIFDH